MSDNLKFIPNPDYWRPIERYWEEVSSFPAICEGLEGRAWSELGWDERGEIAKLYRAAREGLPTGISVYQAFFSVLAELDRATKKFPTWPTDPLHAIGVLGEEFGELTKEVLQLTYEPHKSSLEAVKTEAIQTAAMALRFLASLDHYRFRRGSQHDQTLPPAKPGCALCDRGDGQLGHSDECPNRYPQKEEGFTPWECRVCGGKSAGILEEGVQCIQCGAIEPLRKGGAS